MRQTEQSCFGDYLTSDRSWIKACRHLTICYQTEIPVVTQQLGVEMAALGYPYMDLFSVRFSVGEAISNAIRHAHGGDPNKTVHVSYLVTPEYVLAEVIDEGSGFDPNTVPNPMARENQTWPLGKGLYFMKLFMTWVRYDGGGNRVTLCKMRSEPEPAAIRKDAAREARETP